MLSGEIIVMSIIGKVNARLKFLYRHKKHLDIKCKQLLSGALIQCYLIKPVHRGMQGLPRLSRTTLTKKYHSKL